MRDSLNSLSIRARNVLCKCGVFSLEDLKSRNPGYHELMCMRNCGIKTAKEIIDFKVTGDRSPSVQSKKLSTRNIRITRSVIKGETLDSCAIREGLSRERVRQLMRIVMYTCYPEYLHNTTRELRVLYRQGKLNI